MTADVKVAATMGGSAVDKLIEDSRLILEYAVRVGRLQDDKLPTAIAEAEACIAQGKVPGLASLSKAMNEAVNAIAPVTLVDLRVGRSPFDGGTQRGTRRIQYTLCGFTVILALLIASYSYALHREEGALREYAEIQAAKIPEKTSELRKLVTRDKVLQSKDSRYEQFLRSARELKDLEVRRLANLVTLERLAQEPLWPWEGPVADALGRLGSSGASIAPPAVAMQDAGAGPVLPYTPYDGTCDALGLMDASVGPQRAIVASNWTLDVDQEKMADFCFARKMLLGDGETNYQPIADLVGEIRNRMVLQNTWILPFLTGVLGAVVFLLRDSLNPYTASFGAPRAVVRLAIGGIAGIIIGWFWIPSGLASSELAKGSSIPLALAFITGYSIDILFTALERVRGAVATPAESNTRGAR